MLWNHRKNTDFIDLDVIVDQSWICCCWLLAISAWRIEFRSKKKLEEAQRWSPGPLGEWGPTLDGVVKCCWTAKSEWPASQTLFSQWREKNKRDRRISDGRPHISVMQLCKHGTYFPELLIVGLIFSVLPLCKLDAFDGRPRSLQWPISDAWATKCGFTELLLSNQKTKHIESRFVV